MDQSDAADLYGRTKFLGEVYYPHCVTLRTSIIGHELRTNSGLVDWFLSQQQSVNGFVKAIYSGFPTIELAEIIARYVIPDEKMTGLYHVSSDPVSKYDLLKMVSECYGKTVEILRSEALAVDRSLDSARFRDHTGYVPPAWPALVEKMHQDYTKHREDYHAVIS